MPRHGAARALEGGDVKHTSWTGRTWPVHNGGSFGLRGQPKRCSDVAMQRMPLIAMTAKTTFGQEDPRACPPLVYRDRITGGGWVVEPPNGVGVRAFVGPNACIAALEFAHKTYGCARYLSA